MKALIIADIQNDFLPGGALAVPHGDEVIPIANAVQSHFELIVALRDFHPPGTRALPPAIRDTGQAMSLSSMASCKSFGLITVSRVHLAASLPSRSIRIVSPELFTKESIRSSTATGFFDNGHRKATGLGDWLKERGITDLYVLGLATDY